MVRGARAELKVSLPLTRWPQVYIWSTRYKPRAAPLLGPLLTTATPWLLLLAGPSFPWKGMKIALIFREQRGQFADLASCLLPLLCSRLRLVVHPLPQREGWKDEKRTKQ